MTTFTEYELDCLMKNVRQSIDDCSCLNAWLDSLEYDVKQYISVESFQAFNGFTVSLLQHLLELRNILKSKENDLLL